MAISSEMDRFKKVFWEECNDLLASMEESLRVLNAHIDLEVIHSIFRSIHTIKGGAGSFDLHNVVEFAHAYETLLDLLREQKLAVNDEIIVLLFKSYDVLTDLVRAAESDKNLGENFGQDVLKQLRFITDGVFDKQSIPVNNVNSSVSQNIKENSVFNIKFKPHDNLLHYGNDPLFVFKELKKLNIDPSIFLVTLDSSNIPDLRDLSPNNLYMNWTIRISTSEPETEITNVFEFVSDLCDLKIQREIIETSEPKSSISVNPLNTNANEEIDITVKELDPQKIFSDETSLEKPFLVEGVKNDFAPKSDVVSKNDTVHSLRVEIDRIDRLVNTVGEIVIKQSMVINQAKDLDDAQYTSIVNGLHELSQYTRELQENVMAIRAQPIKSVFSRMPRLVRDLAAQLNKNVSIETRGEDTEIDKTVIENLSEPLIHIIRNAIDHGIESPEERVAANKPKESKIILSAEHKNGRISIQIKDDGKGINRERVRQKAVEKGLISSDAVLIGDEVDNLILLPGFSTAENITNISGRGVGLDVVKKSVQSLGGRLYIQSQEGKGCIFNLTLPLTLAVLDGMVVSCRGGVYIVPLVNIVETLSPKNEQIIDLVGGMKLLKLRGITVPLFFLSDAFKLTNKNDSDLPRIVVVIETESGEIAGIVVDELQGKQQVVMKSLEQNYEPIVGISAATIMGDGSVVPILDVNAICDMRKRKI